MHISAPEYSPGTILIFYHLSEVQFLPILSHRSLFTYWQLESHNRILGTTGHGDIWEWETNAHATYPRAADALESFIMDHTSPMQSIRKGSQVQWAPGVGSLHTRPLPPKDRDIFGPQSLYQDIACLPQIGSECAITYNQIRFGDWVYWNPQASPLLRMWEEDCRWRLIWPPLLFCPTGKKGSEPSLHLLLGLPASAHGAPHIVSLPRYRGNMGSPLVKSENVV